MTVVLAAVLIVLFACFPISNLNCFLLLLKLDTGVGGVHLTVDCSERGKSVPVGKRKPVMCKACTGERTLTRQYLRFLGNS